MSRELSLDEAQSAIMARMVEIDRAITQMRKGIIDENHLIGDLKTAVSIAVPVKAARRYASGKMSDEIMQDIEDRATYDVLGSRLAEERAAKLENATSVTRQTLKSASETIKALRNSGMTSLGPHPSPDSIVSAGIAVKMVNAQVTNDQGGGPKNENDGLKR